MSWRLAAPAIYAVLAIAWTWPAAVSEELVGRHFDLPGTVWFISAAPRFASTGLDPLTSWPVGAAYDRPDSYVLMAIATLAQAIEPERLHALLQVAGVALSAWAADACARAMGVRAPWSLLAGLGFGFSGLAATALLEGHVYLTLALWLPLFAWAWWRATGPDGGARHGLVAGGLWSLCLLSTAYLGMAASLIAVGFFVGGAWRKQLQWPPVIAAGVVVAAVGGLYLSSFAAGSLHSGQTWMEVGFTRQGLVQHGAANLVNLAGPTAELDRADHSRSPTLSATMLALCLAAPLLRHKLEGWGTLLGTAALAFVLSLGPALATPRSLLMPMPLSLLTDWSALELLRFPARLGWAWTLCGGLLAARVATQLASRSRLLALPLVACALVDVFGVVRLQDCQREWLAASPSAYRHAEGPVFDLYPEYVASVGDWNRWFQAAACLYQAEHGRPIADDCVVTHAGSNPRMRLSRAVSAPLLAGDGAAVAAQLGELGFTTLAWHPDLFHPGDRARIAAALAQVDASPVSTTDGGEHVVAYGLSARPAGDPRSAWAELEARW